MFNPWLNAWAWGDALATRHGAPLLWQRHRVERLRALLTAARDGSAWWRKRLRDVDFGAGTVAALLQAVPVATRRESMAHFGGWVTDPALALPALRRFVDEDAGGGEPYLGRYAVWQSSGSSGEPALFVHDALSLAVGDALEATRGPLALLAALADGPIALATARVAFVGAVGGAFASVVSLERLRRLNPWAAWATKAFSFLQPPEALAAELQAWRPTVLATYPSMAWVLAQMQRRGRLQLSLRAVWTGGETLGTPWRRAIGAAFGCPVHDSYGASECLSIAQACVHCALHLNADWVILEPVDEQARPVPVGETGATTLLTYLANRVQPILRYDLGDRVRLHRRRCACGSPLPVVEVEGRDDDVLTLDGAEGQAVHLSPLALATVLEDEGGVFDFRVSPLGRHGLRLQLCGAGPTEKERAAAALRHFLAGQGVVSPRVQVVARAPPLPRGRSGKLRRIYGHEATAA